MFLVTEDGEEIFDWAGYYGSRLIGHNHPRLRSPEYLKRLTTAANNKVPNPDFLTKECLDYYRLVYQLAPECLKNEHLEIYVVNSGAEAVENMMKYLIARHRQKMDERNIVPQARRFVYFEHGFHGRTLGALNVTHMAHNPLVTKDFSELIPGNIRLPFPHVDYSRSNRENEQELDHCLEELDDVLRRYSQEIVAVLLEPIQGAGGHRLALPRFFQKLSQLCHDHDCYLAFDEVQTAGGQCGKLFAVDLFNLPYGPEAIATAKKFGNGVLFMREPLKDVGVLDSTWGGSLTDMVRVVEEYQIVFDENLLSQVELKAKALHRGLMNLEGKFSDLIFNVRGLGLYLGFSLRKPSLRKQLIELALEQENLLLLGAGEQTIRLRPPLDVSLSDIAEFLRRLEGTLASLTQQT
jgi:L-lysine 6-transaminase